MNRRDFLRGAAAVTASSHSVVGWAARADARPEATDLVNLGQTGLKVTRMAIGTGTLGWAGQSNQTRELGIGGLSDLLQYGYERGLLFWDSADQYGTHPHLATALRKVPREKITILTKTSSRSATEVRSDVERFRKELGTDYIDILLLHCVTDPNWTTNLRPAMDVISEAKQRGVVRAHGVSCHSFGALKAAAREPWVEVDLVRINPAGAYMDAKPESILSVLETMKAEGKGVIGMKIFGNGSLTHRIDECLQFVLTKKCVDCFTIGVESRDQLDHLLQRIPANAGKA
ncbi:MAG: aldo/keto reductase [Verrucomicrobia bacterium]|nr:aldo/keto reductase [Verrucomicrobiota bacterium]